MIRRFIIKPLTNHDSNRRVANSGPTVDASDDAHSKRELVGNMTTKWGAYSQAFHLVYLVFYFVPWLFGSPTTEDVLAIAVALVIFLPIFFHADGNRSIKVLPHIAGMSLIGFAISPFFGSHGVFHIYACAQAGFIRPLKTAWLTIVSVSLVYAAVAILLGQHWWDVAFPLFMGLLVAAGTVSTANNLEEQRILRRTNEYDQQMATLAERERIAQDLHDLLGQTLTMVSLKSEVALKLMNRGREQDWDHAKREIHEIRDASREALKDVRAAVSGMNTTTVDAELKRAKKILASAGISTTLKGPILTFETATSHVVGLAIREAVTNIVRHAQATQAELGFDVINNRITVTIHDDGTGPKMDGTNSQYEFREGSGLRGIRHRIESIGGHVYLENRSGTLLTLSLPTVGSQNALAS